MAWWVAAICGVVYGCSHPAARTPYDQTFLIAGQFLQGQLGVEGPRGWLEFVPGEFVHYSVFPLGAVLTMLPAAAAKYFGWIQEVPVQACAALIGSGAGFFSYRLSANAGVHPAQRALLSIFLVFGTWLWANVENGGAWQLALGFALVGELGALYFSLIRPRAILAGIFFALAFGNRTELILLAPLFLFLLCGSANVWPISSEKWRRILGFCIAPCILGFATLAYNQARFLSPFDFGYERIPFLLDDPFYAGGFFSWRGIEPNFRTMFLMPWASQADFPWIRPSGTGESIFMVSPFLLLCFRARARNRLHWALSWLSIAVLTMVLFLHGNAGGYQFGYRYGIILLPFFLWILIESSPRKPGWLDLTLLAASLVLNGYSVYAFYWARTV